jgi:energy-coupling factor transporter ATP-binding protein EcfA2
MSSLTEKIIVGIWNRLATKPRREVAAGGLDIGARIVDDHPGHGRASITQGKRTEHLAILGKTGQGKSYLLRHLATQDITQDHGFLFFDHHGDTMPYLLRRIAQEEIKRRIDLSGKLIVIEPGDPVFSVGLNVLENRGQQIFVQLAEFAEILKQRWGLGHLGARTEELLRNSLHLLADNDLTLLELTALLTNEAFRAGCVARSRNPEVADYFRSRFDQQTEAMQAVYRDAILNKVSSFTADPHFRHILGQKTSTFSLLDAIDGGCWVIVNLDKGRLGEHAATLGSLLLTKVKNALFSRRTRRLFTLYCDEIQNLVAYEGSGLDTLLSEARKFGISVSSANQFLEQYPPTMRAAIMAIGTHIFFQLSSADAEKIGSALDGGKKLTELLKNLPKRHMVIKSGHERWQHALVPNVPEPTADYTDLYNRCRNRWARRRTDVEAEIRGRAQHAGRGPQEVLHGWD